MEPRGSNLLTMVNIPNFYLDFFTEYVQYEKIIRT